LYVCGRHAAFASPESRAWDIVLAYRDSLSGAIHKNADRDAVAAPGAAQGPRRSGVKVGAAQEAPMNFTGRRFVPTHPNIVELDRIGDEIAELSAHLDAATARLLDLIRDFDARGGWNNGFLSCAHWLCYRVGLEMRAARERVRVARALGTLPRLAQALARGELSYSKVRALTRIATPEIEERLLKVGLAGTAEHVERIVRGWRRVDRKVEVEETARRHKHRAVHFYHDDDGMVIIRARLEPQAGAVVIQAITAAREALHQRARAQEIAAGPAGPPFVDGPAEPRYQDGTPAAPMFEQREADALALIAETALHHGMDPGTPGDAIRWWSMSMRRCSRTPTLPASRSSRTAPTFPRKRRSAWRAMRAAS